MKKLEYLLFLAAFFFASCQDPSCAPTTSQHSSDKVKKTEEKEVRSRRW